MTCGGWGVSALCLTGTRTGGAVELTDDLCEVFAQVFLAAHWQAAREAAMDAIGAVLAGTAPTLAMSAVASTKPLLEACKADAAGPKNYAPFLNLYLKGNPLEPRSVEMLEELKKIGTRVHFK